MRPGAPSQAASFSSGPLQGDDHGGDEETHREERDCSNQRAQALQHSQRLRVSESQRSHFLNVD